MKCIQYKQNIQEHKSWRCVDVSCLPKSVYISSVFPVADDVDILGIFLKSFAAVAVFCCLAASVCHSLKRGCFHKKGHNENKWVWATALKKEAGNTCVLFCLWLRSVSTVLLFIMYLFLYFSYNWPAQNNGVDYRDADEVNTACDMCTEMKCIVCVTINRGVLYGQILSHVFFTGPLSPQVIIHHLTAATEDGTETKGKNCWG